MRSQTVAAFQGTTNLYHGAGCVTVATKKNEEVCFRWNMYSFIRCPAVVVLIKVYVTYVTGGVTMVAKKIMEELIADWKMVNKMVNWPIADGDMSNFISYILLHRTSSGLQPYTQKRHVQAAQQTSCSTHSIIQLHH